MRRNTKYNIYEISVSRLIKQHATVEVKDNQHIISFNLDKGATASVISKTTTTADNILMRQMLIMNNEGKSVEELYQNPEDNINAVIKQIIYLNFDGVKLKNDSLTGTDFIYCKAKDENADEQLVSLTHKEAILSILENGVTLTLPGYEKSITFVHFEKSASMSKQKRMSFIDKSIKDKVSERIALGITPKEVNLAKYYAYKGLSLSGGTAINSLNSEMLNNTTVCIVNDFKRQFYISDDGKIIIERKKGGYLFKSTCEEITIKDEHENGIFLNLGDQRIKLINDEPQNELKLKDGILYLYKGEKKQYVTNWRYYNNEIQLYSEDVKLKAVSPDGKLFIYKKLKNSENEKEYEYKFEKGAGAENISCDSDKNTITVDGTTYTVCTDKDTNNRKMAILGEKKKSLNIDNNKVEISSVYFDEKKIVLCSDKANCKFNNYMFHKSELNMFDGEGIISRLYAQIICEDLGVGEKDYQPTSFQVRMPFAKGMLHQVDFHKFYKEILGEDKYENTAIKDIFGVEHKLEDLQIILTESQFKASGWVEKSEVAIDEYWNNFEKFNHCMFVVNVGRKQAKFTTLNYQVVGTPELIKEKFEEIIKPTEEIYKKLRLKKSNDDDDDGEIKKAVIDILLHGYENQIVGKTDKSESALTESDIFCNTEDELQIEDINNEMNRDEELSPKLDLLSKYNKLLGMNIYKSMSKDTAEGLLMDYGRARFLIKGQNRFLSSDLLYFLYFLVDATSQIRKNKLKDNHFYAPKFDGLNDKEYTIFRNPHATRNELLKQKLQIFDKDSLRERYLGHLENVIFLDVNSLQHEVLAGADFDGDRVVVVDNDTYNGAVGHYPIICIEHLPGKDNVELTNGEPSAKDIFDNLIDTFQNRIGQFCNYVFRQTVNKYNENKPKKEKDGKEETDDVKKYTELIGQEIDSAKTGIHPSLQKGNGKEDDVFLEFKKTIKDFSRHAISVSKFYEAKGKDDESLPNLHTLPTRTVKLRKKTLNNLTDIALESVDVKNLIQEKETIETEYSEELKKVFDGYTECLKIHRRRKRYEKVDYDSILKLEDVLLSVFDAIDYEFVYEIIKFFKTELIKNGKETKEKDQNKFIIFKNFFSTKEWYWSDPKERENLLKKKLCELLGADNLDGTIFEGENNQYLANLCNFNGKGHQMVTSFCNNLKVFVPSNSEEEEEEEEEEETNTEPNTSENPYLKFEEENKDLSLMEFKKKLVAKIKDENNSDELYKCYKAICVDEKFKNFDKAQHILFDFFLEEFKGELDKKWGAENND